MNTSLFPVQSLVDLLACHRAPDPPVVEGLLRRGEILNMVASPKAGKSLLVEELALLLTTGAPWLGCATVAGNVIVVDNELSPAQCACRLRAMAAAHPEADLARVGVVLLRGIDAELCALYAQMVGAIRERDARVLILDSLYRALPIGTSENDPVAIMALYRVLVQVARETHVAVIVVHHATKGMQGRRAVTDIGAGAGALARMADSHLVLREHADADCFVAEAAVRSWPAFAPRVITRDQGLTWRVVPDADPGRLRMQVRRRGSPAPPPAAIRAVLTNAHARVDAIVASLVRAGHPCAADAVRMQLDRMAQDGGIYRSAGSHGAVCFGLAASSAVPSKTDQVLAALRLHPEASAADVARSCGCDPKLVRGVRQRLEAASRSQGA